LGPAASREDRDADDDDNGSVGAIDDSVLLSSTLPFAFRRPSLIDDLTGSDLLRVAPASKEDKGDTAGGLLDPHRCEAARAETADTLRTMFGS
jgi:hypothetical protein